MAALQNFHCQFSDDIIIFQHNKITHLSEFFISLETRRHSKNLRFYKLVAWQCYLFCAPPTDISMTSSCKTLWLHNLWITSTRKTIQTYNHGQKSWDKFTFVALFHTRKTNSSTLVHPLPLPPPSYNVGHVYTLFLQSVNIVLGVGGRKQRILKRITVLF